MDDLAVRFAFDKIDLLAHRSAGRDDAVLVDEADLAQLFQNDRHTAGLVKILRDVFAAWPQAHEIRRVSKNVANVEQVEIDPRLVSDGGKVEAGVRRAARAGYDARGVLQRFAGNDVAGANVLFQQIHHGRAGGFAELVPAFVRGGRAG